MFSGGSKGNIGKERAKKEKSYFHEMNVPYSEDIWESYREVDQATGRL